MRKRLRKEEKNGEEEITTTMEMDVVKNEEEANIQWAGCLAIGAFLQFCSKPENSEMTTFQGLINKYRKQVVAQVYKLMIKYPIPEVVTVVEAMPQTCNTEIWKEGEFVSHSTLALC